MENRFDISFGHIMFSYIKMGAMNENCEIDCLSTYTLLANANPFWYETNYQMDDKVVVTEMKLFRMELDLPTSD